MQLQTHADIQRWYSGGRVDKNVDLATFAAIWAMGAVQPGAGFPPWPGPNNAVSILTIQPDSFIAPKLVVPNNYVEPADWAAMLWNGAAANILPVRLSCCISEKPGDFDGGLWLRESVAPGDQIGRWSVVGGIAGGAQLKKGVEYYVNIWAAETQKKAWKMPLNYHQNTHQ